MTATRWAVAALVAAALCATTAALGPAWAGQSAVNRDQKAVQSVQLPEVDGLAPGASAERDVTVRNATGVSGRMHIELVDVRQSDNGCSPPERRVDPSCGYGAGQLGRELITTILIGRSASTTLRRWSGPALRLQRGADLSVALPSGAATVLAVQMSLPTSAGDEIETDTFHYALRVSLDGARGVAGETIGGHHAGPAGTAAGDGGGTVSVGSGSGLSSTGVPVRGIIDLSALLTIVGIVLLAVSRRRRAPG